MSETRILILGAAGRDFHNFNTVYRGDPEAEVVAFTAEQIPNIDERRYPASLAGEGYPEGIPIRPERELEALIADLAVDRVVMAYSDVSHEHVMHLASRANAAGADFALLGTRETMLRSERPVVAVCATRTGSGKSQTSRAVVRLLREAGHEVAVVRHPMPYGDLAAQRVQRFETYDDLDAHDVTIEEREEFEPHLDTGSVVWAGVDYEEILRRAEQEADVVVWDGGNNDTPFYRPDLHLTVADPLRAGHELRYHPGETNARMADVLLINKVDTAGLEQVEELRANLRRLNPDATVLEAASPLFVDDPGVLEGRRVLAVEDGPTLTHGDMRFGAGTLAARKAGATEIVDPRPFARGEIAETFEDYPDVGPLLPAMGYGDQQIRDLQATLEAARDAGVEAISVGTPIDLGRLVELPLPSARVRYELQVLGEPTLEDVLAPWL